jgi:hypothetical protein
MTSSTVISEGVVERKTAIKIEAHVAHRSPHVALYNLGIAMSIVQAFDGVIGALAHDLRRPTDRSRLRSSTRSR